MRQGQQSRRGRNRGGRKPQNSISRNYESSGPDVKIRGTAMHIAEKYASLARDAMSSGDSVAAENYLQHAEHYNRIILAAQAQNPGMPGDQPVNMNGGNRFNQSESFRHDQDDGDEEGGEDFVQQPQLPRFLERPVYNQNQPQPFLPQNAFQHVQKPIPPVAPAPVQNGAPFADGENFPAAPEGAAQRGRRRRRPIGERFNGRPGAAGAPANGAPAGADPAPDEAAS
jgi:Domain of unknown function (DUF4167)